MALSFYLSPSAFVPRLPAFGRCSLKNRISGNSQFKLLRASPESSSLSSATVEGKNKILEEALENGNSQKAKEILADLKNDGRYQKWESYSIISRRTTYLRELTQIGLKNAENLAIPSTRNDAVFLATVVGVTSILAVLAGQLPGDWGFFVPYLIGGISLAVLAIGSVAPGLLQVGIDAFSGAFSDYKERVLRHEAAHFLTSYLLGIPVTGYSLDIGKEHTNLIDESLQKKLYSGKLQALELDKLAVVSMAGLAAEGLRFDKVIGQSADLITLQRFLNRSEQQLSNEQQQNLTRWAVLFAASLIKNNSKEYEALMKKMEGGASTFDCIKAIEST